MKSSEQLPKKKLNKEHLPQVGFSPLPTKPNPPMTKSPNPSRPNFIEITRNLSPNIPKMTKRVSEEVQLPKFSFDDGDSIYLNFKPNLNSNNPFINYFIGLSQSQQGRNQKLRSPEREVMPQFSPQTKALNENFFSVSQNLFQSKEEGDQKEGSQGNSRVNSNQNSLHSSLDKFPKRRPSIQNSSQNEEEEEDLNIDEEGGRVSYVLSFNEDDNKVKNIEEYDLSSDNENENNENDAKDLKNFKLDKNDKNSKNENKIPNYADLYKNFSNLPALTNKKPSDYFSTSDENKDNFIKFYSNNINNYYFSPIINQIQTNHQNQKNFNNIQNSDDTFQPFSFSNSDDNYNIPFSKNPIKNNPNNNNYMNKFNNNPNYSNNSNINKNSYSNSGYAQNNYSANNGQQFSDQFIIARSNTNKKIKRINPNTYMNESYEYLSNNIFLLGKDQIGCRFLQKKIDEEPNIAIPYLYPAVIKYAHPLIKDPFGNYLIQKIITYLSDSELLQFMKILENNILDIGSNTHGTRVIQHLINFLRTPELIENFLVLIKPYIVPLLKELNGTHIIQKFNHDFPTYAQKVVDVIIDFCEELAMHRHGCCVLQKFLNSKDRFPKTKLVNKLTEMSSKLVVDQFGNYVIQSVLKLNNKEVCNQIVDQMLPDIINLSKHKYSSNVVEKCFDFGDERAIKKLINALNNKNVINELILDEHGNYVLQKILYYGNINQRNEILKHIATLIPQIKTLSFGEKLISVLINDFPQAGNYFFCNETKKKAVKKNIKSPSGNNINLGNI